VAFYWDATGKQVRIEAASSRVAGRGGRVLGDAAAQSRLAGASSTQSAPMPDHAWLLARWRRLGRRTGDGPVPRPADWTGYRIVPDAIEFWARGVPPPQAQRLRQTRRGWRVRWLQP
jgi:pyridoxamine 5'-phosphate oxidase